MRSQIHEINDYRVHRERIGTNRPSEKEGDLVAFPSDQRQAWEAFFHAFPKWEARAMRLVRQHLGDDYSYEDEGDITHGALEGLLTYVRRHPRFAENMGDIYLGLVYKHVVLVSFRSRFLQWLESHRDGTLSQTALLQKFETSVGIEAPPEFELPGVGAVTDMIYELAANDGF